MDGGHWRGNASEGRVPDRRRVEVDRKLVALPVQRRPRRSPRHDQARQRHSHTRRDRPRRRWPYRAGPIKRHRLELSGSSERPAGLSQRPNRPACDGLVQGDHSYCRLDGCQWRGRIPHRAGRGSSHRYRSDDLTSTGLACGTAYALYVQPEKSSKDTGGRVATVSGSTAACAASSGAVGSSGGSGGGGGSSSSAAATFIGNFETGNVKPWQSLGGVQCLNYGLASNSDAARGTLSVVTDYVAGGAYSGRFDLPAAPRPSACELLRGRTIAMDDEWYSMEVRFPDNWQEPSKADWGMAIAQLNFETSRGFRWAYCHAGS